MFNLLKDQLLDDVVSRAEQSRVSYNSQTEEFRSLNTNLQTYLNDIKRIDDDNRQLQENIEQIRTSYIVTLENHLKRLPNDFRQQSHTLTDAHLERYKSKSRARRFINERDELKKRIHFLACNEKEQVKRLNNLQKQERSIHNEFIKLNEQIQNLMNYVEAEKQTHRQAMDKVDSLQIHLERVSVERSKTEFEIQTLREEVKLMQTAKEFLDEEHQTILSTQTEANEYLLSRLNESILRIREDFDELNKSQLKQIENDYKQMMQTIEEKTLTNATVDEAILNQQRTNQMEHEQIQDEHRSMTQELTTLNDHNYSLSERILTMESDLYSIRDERMRELKFKDNELDQSKIELQTLNEKLNHLAEYDRNLKFELTLYRGVLEGEHRRKQQQQLISNQQPARPTTLRTNKTYTPLTSRSQGDQLDKVSSNKTRLDEKIIDETDRQEILVEEPEKIFNQDQQQEIETENITSQEEHQTPIEVPQASNVISSSDEALLSESQHSPSATISLFPDDQSLSYTAQESTITPVQVQSDVINSPTSRGTSLDSNAPTTVLTNLAEHDRRQSLSTPHEDRQISSEIQQSPSSSIVPIPSQEQTPTSEAHQLLNAPSGVRALPISPSTDEETSLTSAAPIASEIPQSSTTSLEDDQTPSEDLKSSAPAITLAALEDQTASSESRQSPSTPEDDRQIPSEVQQSPSSSTAPIFLTEQPPSSEAHQSPNAPSDVRAVLTRPSADEEMSLTSAAPILSEGPQSSFASLENHQTPSKAQELPPISRSKDPKTPSEPPKTLTTPIGSENQTDSFEARQSPATSQEDRQIPSEVQQSPSSSTAPTLSKDQSPSSEGYQSLNTPLDIRALLTRPSADEETSLTSATPILSEGPQSSFTSLEERQAPTEDLRSSAPAATLTPLEDQTAYSEIRQSPSTPRDDRQISSEVQQSPSSSTAPTLSKDQSPSSEGYQSLNTPLDIRALLTRPSADEETSLTSAATISSEGPQSSFTSLEDRQAPTEDLGSSAPAATLTALEDQTASSEIRQSPSTPEDDGQILSEAQQSASSSTTPILSTEQPSSSKAHQSPNTLSEVRALLMRPSADEEMSPTSAAPILSEIPQSSFPSLEDRQIPSEVQQSPSPSNAPILSTDQSPSSEGYQSLNTPLDVRALLTRASADEETSLTSAATISSEIPEYSSTSLKDDQTSPEDLKPSALATALTDVEDQTASSESHQPPSTPEDDGQILSEVQQSASSSTTPIISTEQRSSSEAHQSPNTLSEVRALLMRPSADEDTSLTSAAPISSEIPQSSASLEDQQIPTHVQELSSISPSTSPRETSLEASKSPSLSTTLEDQVAELCQLPSPTEELQPSPTDLPSNERTPREAHKSSALPTDVVAPTNLSISSEVRQSPSIPPENRQSASTPSEENQSVSSDIQQTMSIFSQELQQFHSTDEIVQEQLSSIPADAYRATTSMSYSSNDKASPTGETGDKSYLTKSPDRRDSDVKDEEKTKSLTQDTDELATIENDNNERRQSTHSINQSTSEEYDNIPSDNQEFSTLETTSPSEEETKQNGHSSTDNESILKQEIINEEDMSSSHENKTEEDSNINYNSSSGYDDILSDSTLLTHQEPIKSSSSKTSLIDVEIDNTDLIGEAGSSASPKMDENELDDNSESNLEAAMQDLRYVYRNLANDENLLEINDEFPNNLIDRLEFGDNLIQTVFDALLTKYIVQAAKAETRSKTLDWIEFRDILFPIITGRYMERHIRKLFQLFDTSKDGYLSLQEIIDLFELLQVNNTVDLAQNMINEYDKSQDGRLSVDELIEAITKADDMNNNILSDDIENKQWYIQHPTDEDIPSISLDVPTVNFSSKNDEIMKIFNDGIILLARIFKRVGADVENKQLDSNKATLMMKITNDFVNNNIHISNVDLQAFIQLYLTKKQNSDCFINWIEFRDVFLPIINGGMLSKEDIARWFKILDTNQNGIITREQILHLLRLLQITNSKEVVNKMNEISETYTNNNDSWTLDELIFALENINETACHIISNNEQITSFDLEWLNKNIF